MYFSYGDGRLPTKDDNDYYSKMRGADFVQIDTSDSFWNDKNIESKIGIFVLAIEAKTPLTNYALQSFINSQDITYETSSLVAGDTLEN
jgi:hypothetical protein